MTIQARFRAERDAFVLDVDLELPDTGITALYGPSGCGKTTLLRAIAGLDHHPNGGVKLGDMTWQSSAGFTAPHRRSVALVFQEASLFPHLDVQQNLAFALRRVPVSGQRFSLGQIVDLLDLSTLLSRRPETLSGGEQRRVAIGRALASSPSVLLLDEPLVGLDQARKAEILPYLVKAQKQLDIPFVYVSHSLDEVAQLAHHLVLLDQGRVIAVGDIHDILTRLDLPLANMASAAAIIDAKVTGHDDSFHLTELEFSAGTFHLPREDLATGSDVRLRLAARDVSLVLERPSGTSILNIFPATVDAMSDYGPAQVTVRLLARGRPLLARITRKSASALQLKSGQMVYAQAKSIALFS